MRTADPSMQGSISEHGDLKLMQGAVNCTLTYEQLRGKEACVSQCLQNCSVLSYVQEFLCMLHTVSDVGMRVLFYEYK